jgi:2-dehydro-3-deoxy-phosphogluconate/2-dehydro-3-deoxy-6-phosphogalactonate aldolase
MEIVSPILTPFNRWGEIDKEKLKEHARELIRAGIDKIFLNGTTGLGPSLTTKEKIENLKVVYDVTDKIIVQLGGLDLKEVLEAVKTTKDFNIVGIASYSPYYYPRIPEKHLIKYFKTLCETSPHPVYLYNIPIATGKDINAKLANEIGCLRGVKDTTENISHSMEYKVYNNMIVYNGSNSLVMISLSLLDGSVASGTNFLPEIYLAIRNLIKNGKFKEAWNLQLIINEIMDIAREYGNLSAFYPLVKYFRGYEIGYPRPPIFPLEEFEIKELYEKLVRIKSKLIHLNIIRE